MDYLQLIEGFGVQLKDALSLSREIRLSQKPDAVVVCGMGQAGSVGDIIANLGSAVPVVVNKSDQLPQFVDRNTLVFCISYSGTHQEIIQCAQSCLQKRAKLIIITSGGKLIRLAEENNVTLFKLPPNHFEYLTLGYMLVPAVSVLINNGLTSVTIEDITNTSFALSQSVVKQKALDLAQNIGQKTPVVYSPHQLYSAANHVKESLNRIAKLHACSNFFPEIVHAEQFGINKSAHLIVLRDQNESVVVRNSIDTFKAHVNKMQFTELMMRGDRLFNKIMLAILFGEYLAYFLAQRTGVNIKV
ncbi:MAG: SIS domain-containing protein [Candidatus Aenigmarchaeota archaeon]|nr:SIS domain-containing protein [Candidatus Aenigmarchaeota archaeon]